MKRYLFALCLYLPTTGFFSPVFYSMLLIFPLLEMAISKEFIIKKDIFYVIVFVLIAALALGLNMAINSIESGFIYNSSGVLPKLPYIILLVFSMVLIKSIDAKTIKILIFLILIEVMVGGIEYCLNTRSLFFSWLGVTGFNESEYWYYHKVYGLSNNSTPFAFKCLLGIILLFYIKETVSRRFLYLCTSILIVGLMISFSRSALIATFIFFTMYLFKIYTRLEQRLTLLFCYVIGFLILGSTMLLQFNRGHATVDYSYRDIIFQKYSEYISNHLVWGNSGAKLHLTIDDRIYHAHNSFIELFASNGIVVASIFLALLAVFIRKKNAIYILPVIIFSMLQYGVFWGVSFYDVIFFFLLFNIATFEKDTSLKEVIIK